MSDLELIKYEFDVALLNKDLEWFKLQQYLSKTDHQICLNGIDQTSTWRDGVGKLLDRYPEYQRSMDIEKRFTQWLPEFNMTYARHVYDTLSQRWHLGRMRLMEIRPKTCYTWHKDVSRRLHIAINTDHTRCGLIIEDTVHRIPADGNVYLADTTKYHTAYNAMEHSRYHLVAVIVENE
jgi:Aspartyl/Asparaginyl beta-hydroxylase